MVRANVSLSLHLINTVVLLAYISLTHFVYAFVACGYVIIEWSEAQTPRTTTINTIVLAVEIRAVTELEYPQWAMNDRRTELSARNIWPRQIARGTVPGRARK